MIANSQIERLLKLSKNDLPIVSLYLSLNSTKRSHKETINTLRKLIKEVRNRLGDKGLAAEQEHSVRGDIRNIENRIFPKLTDKSKKGICAFACSDDGLFEIMELPSSPLDTMLVERSPYLRPLLDIISEHKRFGVLLVDRRRARLFEVFAGDIFEHKEIFDDVPPKVKVAGWYGLEERKIERSIDKKVAEHLKHTAEETFRTFRHNHFDYLILGTHSEMRPYVESFLHSYIREHIVGYLDYGPEAERERVLDDAMKMERGVINQGHTVLLDDLFARGNKTSAFGLGNVIKAVNIGAVGTLLVDANFTQPGTFCSSCGYLSATAQNGDSCPICANILLKTEDVVHEIVKTAVSHGSEVHHIKDKRLAENGKIGAILRFPVE